MGQEESIISDSVPPKTLTERSLEAVAEYIKSGDAKRIVVLTGAGISTAAGIPDFRSPKTGLYNNLARLNLPYAEAVFDISYFRNHPDPFYVLAHELYPGKFYPTVSHAFINLLAQKDLLLRLFTQNIDCLERSAGVPSDLIVEAHGSFATQRCIECKTEYPDDKMKEHVFAGDVPRCEERGCNGLVKPDIVFFGEALPKRFDQLSFQTQMADLVLVIGTSLTVYPFAGLPEMAQPGVPRVLFNMERVGQMGARSDDVQELGSCDDGIRRLADLLGWRDELEKLWRDTVGDEEADRQLRSQEREEDEVEEEVQKLTAQVEAALKLDDEDEKAEEEVQNLTAQVEAALKLDDDDEKAEEAVNTKIDGNLKDVEAAKQGEDKEEKNTLEDHQPDLSKETSEANPTPAAQPLSTTIAASTASAAAESTIKPAETSKSEEKTLDSTPAAVEQKDEEKAKPAL